MKTRLNLLITALFLTAFIAVGNYSAKGTELSASSHVETEETMNLEYWMLDMNYLNFYDVLAIEKEDEPRVEEWMIVETDQEPLMELDINHEEDPELNLEDWMMNS